MKTILCGASCAVLLLGAQIATATERYVTFSVNMLSASNDLGGFNTAGTFFNTDSQASGGPGISVSYGLKDLFAIAGLPVSTEFDLGYTPKETLTSASFPGLPFPTFFYDTEVSTIRIGASFWAPIAASNNYRTEVGVGLGGAYRDVSVSDGVVFANDSDFVAYGQVGLRHVWKASQKGTWSIGLNYRVIDDLDVPLAGGGGTPAGNYTLGSQGLELVFGYSLPLGG